jgi:hypothetical protein
LLTRRAVASKTPARLPEAGTASTLLFASKPAQAWPDRFTQAAAFGGLVGM